MGSGGGGGGDTTVRFAPYMETAHQQLINSQGAVTLALSCFAAMNAAAGNSPYKNAVTVDVSDGFLGSGYTIASFPSLFDMFGKFMAGLDVEVLWSQIYYETVQGPEVADAMESAGVMLQDEIDTRVMPKFLTGFRDINAVQSSAFVTGKALIADSKIKTLGETLTKMKLHLFDLSQERWVKHLAWNTSVIQVYGELQKMFYAASFDEQSRTMEYAVKDALWDLSLFEYGRAIVGALNGAAASSPQNQPSQAAKSIAGVAAGAAVGSQIGSSINSESGASYGGAIGGVVGLAASFL